VVPAALIFPPSSPLAVLSLSHVLLRRFAHSICPTPRYSPLRRVHQTLLRIYHPTTTSCSGRRGPRPQSQSQSEPPSTEPRSCLWSQPKPPSQSYPQSQSQPQLEHKMETLCRPPSSQRLLFHRQLTIPSVAIEISVSHPCAHHLSAAAVTTPDRRGTAGPDVTAFALAVVCRATIGHLASPDAEAACRYFDVPL